MTTIPQLQTSELTLSVLITTPTQMLALPATNGTKPIPIGFSGVTVCKQLIEKGIIAVGFGPGDEDQAHIANESIEIQELLDFGKIMGLVIFDILK